MNNKDCREVILPLGDGKEAIVLIQCISEPKGRP